jgi:hypothetical protein
MFRYLVRDLETLLVPEDSKIDVERWLSVTVRKSNGRDASGGREKHFLIVTV